jgi:RNA polymerase sigma-70 factor (ECF subfamily)
VERAGEPSDAEVVAASLAEPRRFGELFDRHATVLHRYVVRRIGPADAGAIVGEVFRIAFEKRDRYDCNRESARPWLYGIATNLVAKHRRGEGRRLRAVARLAAARDDPRADIADAVTDRVDAARRWERVADAVTALPQPERDALVLHVWEGLAYDDIAVALDVPVGTVRSRLNRARTRLRELAADRGEEPHDNIHGRNSGRIES